MMMLSVCWHTVHTTYILLPSAWLYRSCWWRSRLEIFLGSGRIRHFSTFLSLALTQAGMEIHGGGCYHIIVWAEEYAHVGQGGSKTLTRMWQKSPCENLQSKTHFQRPGAKRSTTSGKPIVSVENPTSILWLHTVARWGTQFSDGAIDGRIWRFYHQNRLKFDFSSSHVRRYIRLGFYPLYH